MAITAVNVVQTNIVGSANLLAAHSPIAFIATVDYTGVTPTRCNVEIRDKTGTLVDTYRAIPYSDITATQRQFVFFADEPIRSLLGDFDEFVQTVNQLVYVDGLTGEYNIRFVDPDNAATYDEVLIDFAHASRQFGAGICMEDQYDNDPDNYYAPEGNFVYVYFYNADEANLVSAGISGGIEGFAQDFDDQIFTDYDDDNFTILII